jgi:hypothetical protein
VKKYIYVKIVGRGKIVPGSNKDINNQFLDSEDRNGRKTIGAIVSLVVAISIIINAIVVWAGVGFRARQNSKEIFILRQEKNKLEDRVNDKIDIIQDSLKNLEVMVGRIDTKLDIMEKEK